MTKESASPGELQIGRVSAALADQARITVLRAMCRDGAPGVPVFDRMTRLAAQLLRAPVALGTLVDIDRQILASAYDPANNYRVGEAMPLRYSFCQYAVADCAPFIVPDARTHEVVRDNPAVTENGVGAYAGVPVFVAGQPMGTLCVIDHQPRQWSEEELSVLNDLALAAATELELRYSLTEATRLAQSELTVRRLKAIQSVTDAALKDRPLDELLDELLRRIRAAMNADSATLLLPTDAGDALQVRASIGALEEISRQPRVPIGRGIVGRIAATGQAEIVRDVRSTEVMLPELLRDVRSLIGVPLLNQGAVFGVLIVGTRDTREFDSEEVRLLELVAERAATAIERARLYERERAARVAAESASRAKAAFLAVMSHELRTPLNAIGGYAQLLREGLASDPAAASGWVDRILHSQQHLHKMIARILSFADVDAGREQITSEAVAVGELFNEVERSIRPACDAAGLRFVRASCPDELRIDADPMRVMSILQELMSNAVKFTPRGGEIRIGCRGDGDMVVLELTDTGAGIPKERLEDVFHSFVQVDQSSTRQHEGIGLGLAMSRALARAMGGDLLAHSEVGAGTTMELRLERAR